MKRFIGHFAAQNVTNRDEFFQIDTGFKAARLAKVYEVLHHDIACSIGRSWEPSKSAKRRIENPCPLPDRRRRIG